MFPDTVLCEALCAALDVLLLLRFSALQLPGRWDAQTVLLKISGSLLLMWLQSRNTRRNARLLQHNGREHWDFGWNRLWTEPCLYPSFPFPLRACKQGAVVYVGETVSFRRRFEKHILRLLDMDGQLRRAHPAPAGHRGQRL